MYVFQVAKVLAVFNVSKEPHTVHLTGGPGAGSYTDYFSGEKITVDAATPLTLPAWGWRVFVK